MKRVSQIIDEAGGIRRFLSGARGKALEQNGLRKAWVIAQDVVREHESAGDVCGAYVADQICRRIEKELGI